MPALSRPILPILTLPLVLAALACTPVTSPVTGPAPAGQSAAYATPQHVPVQFRTADIADCDPRRHLLVPASWEDVDPDNEPDLVKTIRTRTSGSVSVCSMFRPQTRGSFPILLVVRLAKPLAASTAEEAEKRLEPLRMNGLRTTGVSLDPDSRMLRAQMKDTTPGSAGYVLNLFVPDQSPTGLLFVATETAAREHEATIVRIAQSFR